MRGIGAEPDEHAHASSAAASARAGDWKRGESEPKGARWLENHFEGFGRTAIGQAPPHAATDTVPVISVLHAPSSG